MLDESGKLQRALAAFVGATLTRVRIGTGEIFVEFDQADGPWSLGTSGSMWALIENDHPVVQYQDSEDKVERFAVARGRQVIGVDPGMDGSGLRVDLGEGLIFFIIRSGDDVAPDLPIFELSTPSHRVITLHRDGVVDDVPGDVPIRDLGTSGTLHHWPTDSDRLG